MEKILNVNELRTGLQGLANTYPDLAELIVLPEKTYERQDSFALVIGRRPRCRVGGVMITSGMHGREWGGPDICLYLAADILEAYTAGAALKYANKLYSAAVVKRMVERMTLVVFPCVNPDGVRYSHANPGLSWRKNRNPTDSTPTNPWSVGVDVCRNFDFLWDYKQAFDPAAIWAGMASDQPAVETYHGPSSFSEPETRNVRWLLDRFPYVTHYLDLHSHSGFIIYPWGDDENQFFSFGQNFRNSAWDKKRGVIGRPYGENINFFHNWSLKGIANAISAAIGAVGAVGAVGTNTYSAHQLFLMPAFGRPSYATSGVSLDWVYSRHITDRSKGKVLGFGIEFNKLGKFDISYKELEVMLPEVTAGLVRLCEAATPGFWAHLILCRILGHRD